MGRVTTIGLDIAKSVFQVHGIDAGCEVVLRRRVMRARLLAFFAKLAPCLIGIEECATSHYWARELRKLGHDVRLMPPSYVKPYVKRQKNDTADAEAICEAVSRPTMRFVEVNPSRTPTFSRSWSVKWRRTETSIPFSAKRWAYSDRPSLSSQSAICCIAAHPCDGGYRVLCKDS